MIMCSIIMMSNIVSLNNNDTTLFPSEYQGLIHQLRKRRVIIRIDKSKLDELQVNTYLPCQVVQVKSSLAIIHY